MKYRWAVVLLIGLCSTRAWAQTQTQTDTLVGVRDGSIELGIAGGVSIPVADYADLAKVSGTGAVVFGYYLSPRFSLGLDIGGHWHGATDLADSLKSASLGQSSSDLSLKLYRIFTPYAKFQLSVANVSPYVTGLAGVYLQEAKWTVQTPLASVHQSDAQGYLGVALGLGIQKVTADNVMVFVEGRMHNAMREGAAPIQFIDVRAGMAFLL